MIRSRIFSPPAKGQFIYKNTEVFRIEGLSDAVFAFSISLLVASLEVPQTFRELKLVAVGSFPFLATVAMIFLFWYHQYVFFRRYGLNDKTTILLNFGYLAVILFYVYPLKFLFTLLLSAWTGIDLFAKASEHGLVVLDTREFPQLIILFSAGYMLIWIIIYFMYKHVLRSSARALLSDSEREFTAREARGALWNGYIGLAGILFSWANQPVLSGICFLLIPLALWLNRRLPVNSKWLKIKMRGVDMRKVVSR